MGIEVQLIERLSGHKGAVFALEKSSTNPQIFYSGGGTGMVVEWNLTDTFSAQLLAQVPGNIFTLKLIPESSILVIGTMIGDIYFLDLVNKKMVLEPDPINIGQPVHAFEVIGKELLVADAGGKLTKISLENYETLSVNQIALNSLRSLEYHKETDTLAIGSSDTFVYLLSEGLKKMEILDIHSNSVFCTQFLDSKNLLSGSRDAHLGRWLKATGAKSWSNHNYIPAHNFTINSIAYNPISKLIATASRDSSIKIWDRLNFKLLKVLNEEKFGVHTHSVNAVIWLEESDRLISGSDDRGIGLWEIKRSEEV